MNWRPWVVAAMVMAAGITNVALLVAEDVEPPEQEKGPSVAQKDQLATLPYTAGARLSNFKKYGMPDQMADEANKRATNLVKDRGELYSKLLVDNSQVATRVFCPGAPLPPRYGAVQVLIVDEDGVRRVIEPQDLRTLEIGEWYALSPAKDVYEELELSKERKDEATMMGVAAILLGKEDAAIEREAPWGSGFTTSWSASRMLDQNADKKIRGKLIDYFALMHALTEIANGERGVCQ